MAGPIKVDTEAVISQYTSNGSKVTGIDVKPSGGKGIDPDVASAVKDGDKKTKDLFDKTKSTTEKGSEHAKTVADSDKKSGDKFSKVGDLASQLGKFASSVPQTQMPSMPSTPSMPTSSLPQATQAQVNSAPNKDELIQALMGATTNSDGSKTAPDGTTVANAKTSGPSSRGEGKDGEVQDFLEEINSKGYEYAWGGGGLDGPSQGIRDGGTADSFGDYNKVGFDCSGLSRYVNYQMFGVEAPRTSQEQYSAGTPVSASEARPGDMVFPSSAGRPPMHVQVYAGDGKVFEAQKSGTQLMYSDLDSGAEFRRFGD